MFGLMDISSKHWTVFGYVFPVWVLVILLSSWLDMPGLASSSGIRENVTDKHALLEFKSKIIGDRLGVLDFWNNSVHFCQWYGVTCSQKHQRVTKLELQSLKLVGSISPYIGNLSFLRVLNLENNSFTNGIPQEIGRLRRMQTLKLLNNSITGEIPSNLSSCSSLTDASFGNNLIGGEIPNALGLLSNLKVFSLSRNDVQGRIPPSLGNCSSLEHLSLAYNKLNGPLPESLGKLKNLTYLAVFDNGFSGTIPPSIFNLSNMKYLYFGINQFQGSLPPDLGLTMPYIEWLDFGDNQITGLLPASLSNASHLTEFQVQKNKLSGNLAIFEKMDKLSGIRINDNLFGTGGATDLNFLCTLNNATNLAYLDISRNNFGGPIPDCISNLPTNLAYLIIQQNKILGRIPDGIGNLINLEVVAATGNLISGSIPPVIGRLKKLKVFYASNNSLSGVIPHTFGNLTMLTELELDRNKLEGNIPSDLGRCTNLIKLDLSHNNLSGSIPPEVIGLRSLSISLNLSSNSLTGKLPTEVGNLKNLGILDVSLNKLSGVLPNNLDGCVRLEELYLEGNFFQGPIPSLSSLRGLEALDLSSNNLSGEIPEFLGSFELLQYLNLSFNDFQGALPTERAFKNASFTFIEGNKKLCGGNPDFHLPTCPNLKRDKMRSNKAIKLVIGIVSGLLGMTLLLCFLFLFWFRRKKVQQSPPLVENSMLKLSYQSILTATDGFSLANLVGSGSFGSVYKGIIEENGLLIAVKVLHLSSAKASKSFMAECEALRNVRHRNLVKILTACSGIDYQGNDFRALVYEFMGNGSLEDWLHHAVDINIQEERKSLNLSQLVTIAVDVAQAMEYLHHHCETPIVHCDLKPSNILLNDEMVGHVADFGLAKFLPTDSSANLLSSLGIRGTIGYAPPEYGLGSNVSTKGDVYSYGIMLLEMVTGKRPTGEMFKDGLSLHDFVKPALPGRVAEIVNPLIFQENVRGDEKLVQQLGSILEIGVGCSAESPSERMEMKDVTAKLRSIKNHILST